MDTHISFYAERFAKYFNRYGSNWQIIGTDIRSTGYLVSSLTMPQVRTWYAIGAHYVDTRKVDVQTGAGAFAVFVEYFYHTFTHIPAEQWCTGGFTKGEQYCALGHCKRLSSLQGEDALVARTSDAPLSQMLNIIMPEVVEINDGIYGYDCLGKTPKERIIKALKRIRKGESIL